MNSRIASVALATAFITAGLAAPAAQAVPVDDFDAQLLGTTASEQLTRMPSLSDVQCADATCSTGIFPEAALSLVEYSTTRIMPDAGYTRVPEFRRGVNVLWRDMTVQPGDTSFASFTIAEFEAESDMTKVMQAVAAQTGTPLTPSTVGGVTVYSGEVLNASEDENDFSGTSFKSAYVLGTDSFIRAGCQAGDSGVQSSRCTVANLIPLAVSIATKQPAKSVPGAKDLEGLAPVALPAGLEPLVVANASDARPWAIDVSNRKLLAALDGQPTAMAQYTLQGSPRMYVSTLSTKLTKPGQARGFLDRPCRVTVDDVSCTDRELPKGRGTVTLFTDDTANGAVEQVTVEGLAGDSLLSLSCFKRQAVSGYLTKKEIATCTSLGSAMLTGGVR